MDDVAEPAQRPEILAEGGDAACWLGRVCPECGGLDESPAAMCARCGAALPDGGDGVAGDGHGGDG